MNFNMIRTWARKLGFGRKRLQIAQAWALGSKGIAMKWFSKSCVLPRIISISPVDCAGNEIEVHMLLEHRRVLEGAWAIRSLVRFPGNDFLPVFHDDGSLTTADIDLLGKLFPGCRVITRTEAENKVDNYLIEQNFQNCRRLRNRLNFSLKLIDVIYFSQKSTVMLLDSDVLFFKDPMPAFRRLLCRGSSGYMKDIKSQYCCPAEKMRSYLGREVVDCFNPGVAIVPINISNIILIEKLLEDSDFWREDGSADYFAELTLWAALLDPESSVVLPGDFVLGAPNCHDSNVTAAHYCGDVKSKAEFYLSGIKKISLGCP